MNLAGLRPIIKQNPAVAAARKDVADVLRAARRLDRRFARSMLAAMREAQNAVVQKMWYETGTQENVSGGLKSLLK